MEKVQSEIDANAHHDKKWIITYTCAIGTIPN